MSRQFGALPANAYRAGDQVLGDDGEGGTEMGVVLRVDTEGGEVLVRWNVEEYKGPRDGDLCDPAWLRLWPASAQEARLRESAGR